MTTAREYTSEKGPCNRRLLMHCWTLWIHICVGSKSVLMTDLHCPSLQILVLGWARAYGMWCDVVSVCV